MRASLKLIWAGAVFAVMAGTFSAFLAPVKKPATTDNPVPTSAPQSPVMAAVPSPVVPVIPPSRKNSLAAGRTSANPVIPPALSKIISEGSRAPMPPDPVLTENDDGSFSTQSRGYVARMENVNGLTYRPVNEKDGNPSGVLKIRLNKATRGNECLYDVQDEDADDPGLPTKEGATVTYSRGAVMDESFKARGDGIEQSFILDDEPEGTGDLVFQIDVTSEGLVAEKTDDHHRGGIFFKDASGKIAAKYGQVVVRSANHDGLVCEPKLSDDGKTIAFSVSGDWLSKAEYPVVVDPLVGKDFFISPDNGIGVEQPTVAGGNNNFLVVWTDYRDSTNVLLPRQYATIVTTGGLFQQPFPISSASAIAIPYRFQRTEIAYDGTNWLVVWSDTRGNLASVHGAIVKPDGYLLQGTDFTIADTSGNIPTEDPIVCYNGSEYVVAYMDTPPNVAGGSQIYFKRVSPNGVVSTFETKLPIARAPASQYLYRMAADTFNNETLIIYRENTESPPQTRAVRIARDGTVKDSNGISLFYELARDGGYGRPIGAHFINNEWNILSSPDQTIDSSIYLHKLSRTGVITPPTGVFATMGVSSTGADISGQLIDSYAPAFPGANEWLFVRNQKINTVNYHLLGKRVTFAGVDKDPEPFRIDTATQGVLYASVAGYSNNTMLVAWSDGRRSDAQPSHDLNIFASLIDTTWTASTGTTLKAVIDASSTSGEAPLTVHFDSALSEGTYDTLRWDFGDNTSSTQTAIDHVYKTKGTFIARLRLTRGSYNVYETVVIVVGGGGSSDTATQVGTPLTNSAGIESGLFVRSVALVLDFDNNTNDFCGFAGEVDIHKLPDQLAGTQVTAGIGSYTQTFALDIQGNYETARDTTPYVRFSVDKKTGKFACVFDSAELQNSLLALGYKDETITPSKTIETPFTLSFNESTVTASVGVLYKTKLHNSGTGKFTFLSTGSEVSGAFLIDSFRCNESIQRATKLKSHSFHIKGQLIQPNGGIYRTGPLGSFTFYIGNYNIAIPVGLMVLKRGTLLFYARGQTTGLQTFKLTLNSGTFKLDLIGIPAEIDGGSNLPVAHSGANVTKVDLNLSFKLDLRTKDDEAYELDAGRFIYIQRKDSGTKTWTLR